MAAFNYSKYHSTAYDHWADYLDADYDTPDELAAVRALRDHLNTYPGIDDGELADDLVRIYDIWKLRADYIDALARRADLPAARRALVAALDASGDQVM